MLVFHVYTALAVTALMLNVESIRYSEVVSADSLIFTEDSGRTTNEHSAALENKILRSGIADDLSFEEKKASADSSGRTRPISSDDLQSKIARSGIANFLQYLIGSLEFDNKVEPNMEFTGDVYVVGNGPLMEEDHAVLRKADSGTVFRCNGMLNLQLTEPVGVVYARALTAGGHYWGVTDTRCPRIANAEEIIFIGGRHSKGNVTKDVENFKQTLPPKKLRGVYLSKADESDEPYTLELQGTVLHCPDKQHGGHGACKGPYGWSTGFLAMVITRQRFPNAKFHIMGMNWNDRIQAHPWKVEKYIIENLPWITVHQTETMEYHDSKKKSCQW